MNKLGQYIVIDGIDGGGKGTLFEELRKVFLEGENSGFVYTREPGGTDLGEKLRKLLLYQENMDPYSEFSMFLEQREELREKVIAPTLFKGIHVISDRSDSSTFAYQVKGKNLFLVEERFWETRQEMLPLPSFYIFLDLDPEIAALRRKKREGEEDKQGDRFDRENLEFFHRVRDGFKEFAQKSGIPSVFVDASATKEVVAGNVIQHIRDHLAHI